MKPWIRTLVTVAAATAISYTAAVAAQDATPADALTSVELRRDLERQVSAPPPSRAKPQEFAVFLHKRAVANMRLGRYGLAATDLREALALQLPPTPTFDGWGGRWRMQMELRRALEYSGDVLGALAHVEIVLQEHRGRPLTLAGLEALRADYSLRLGELEGADAAMREVTRALEEARSRDASPRSRDASPRSRGASQRALLGWLPLIEQVSAKLLDARGKPADAEKIWRASLRTAEENRDEVARTAPASSDEFRLANGQVGNSTFGLIFNLSLQGKLAEAEVLATDYLRSALSYSTTPTLGLRAFANVKLQRGRLADAERADRLVVKSLEASEIVRHSQQLAFSRAHLGFVLGAQSRWKESLSLFEARDRDLRSDSAQFGRFGSLHIDWAMAQHRTGMSAVAANQLRLIVARAEQKSVIDPVALANARGYLGVVLAESTGAADAREQFHLSLPVLMARAAAEASEDAGGFVAMWRLRTIVEGYLTLLGRCHTGGCTVDGIDPVSDSFRIADVARGSVVQRAVTTSVARASLPDPNLRELARKEQSTTNRIDSLRRVMERLASASGERRLNTVISDIQRDIGRLESERKSQRKELADRFPDYASLVAPQPASLAEVQNALGPDEAAVAIYVAEEKTYVWTIAKEQVSFRVVAKGREELGMEIEHLRSSLEFSGDAPRPFDHKRAHELYQLLLARDAALWMNAKILNVIPHGPLGQLPFGVLLTDSGAGVSSAQMPWLIRKVAIAQQASATAFLALRNARTSQPPTKPLAGFGDPIFGENVQSRSASSNRSPAFRNLSITVRKDEMLELVETAQKQGKPVPLTSTLAPRNLAQAFALLPALPDTADELKAIAQALGANAAQDIYVGARATERNVKDKDLSSYRVIVFATHGLVPGEIPGLDQPALALSNPRISDDPDNDGFLTMEEVLALQLNAEWVVLSACNTAGSDGRASEAVSGLGRAFFYAGARALLLSNWPVETVSARLITTGIFRQRAQIASLSRAEALRQSMLDVMAREPYAHPVFWGPFSIVGDGGNR